MEEREVLRELSDRLVDIQRPIRILDAVAWTDDVEAAFFAAGARRQPPVDRAFYEGRPLRFDPGPTQEALRDLDREVARRLGSSPVATILQRRIAEYRTVIRLLEARGTPRFATLSGRLYGHSADRLHRRGPTLRDLGDLMTEALAKIDASAWEDDHGRTHDAAAGVEILRRRLGAVFDDPDEPIRVMLDDGIVADAAAGGDYIKLRENATFTDRDLRVLEVHEGWVHVATTLNGRRQPWCTFLGKGTPSTTATQEGLAVLIEVVTFSSSPARLRRITQRINAIAAAEEGATFLDVYRLFLDHGMSGSDAYASTVRVFRGSTPTDGPFAKDLVYGRGFLEVYNFLRLAVREGVLERIPLLFVGKLALHNLGLLAQLADEGLVEPPRYLPPQIADLSALATWMAYSNFLNRVHLERVAEDLAPVLGTDET